MQNQPPQTAPADRLPPSRPQQTGPQIRRWAEQFPELVRLREHKTFTGATAYAVTVTDRKAGGPKKRLLVSQPHAHEPAATAGMMSFLSGLLTGRGIGGQPAGLDRRRILERCEITLIPDGNPAGRSRAPVEFWDGGKYTNEEFLKIAFGTSPDGSRFPRQGRWSLRDKKPATVGIVYEQVSATDFVEPNRDRESTFFHLILAAMAEGPIDRLLDLHQTEFEKSPLNAEVLLPFMQADLPAGIRQTNERWGRAIIAAWRKTAGAAPRGDPRPLKYGEDQIRYFRACWSDIYGKLPAVSTEIQNNSPRTPPALQVLLQETAILATIEDMLAEERKE